MASDSVLLLTGRPGIGKTTVIRTVAAALPDVRLAGFYTAEVREGGARRGFRAVAFDGGQALIAATTLGGPERVGRYGVDVAAIDRISTATLLGAADVYLVDEIGKMECLSATFVTAMRRLLAGPAPVVATVGQRGGGLIAEAKGRPDAEVWEVTLANRAALPERVLAWLGDRGVSRRA